MLAKTSQSLPLQSNGNTRRQFNRPATAALELAILLPFLCFMFVITVDFARIFYFSITVTNCANIGAVYGSSDPIAANDRAGILARVQKDASNLDLQRLSVTSTTDSDVKPTTVTVTVNYPFTTITRFPGVPVLTTLRRSVQMNVTPFLPN